MKHASECNKQDAIVAGLPDDDVPFHAGGSSATAYADVMTTYLGLGVSRSANTNCSLAIWSQSRDQSVNLFSRQAIPMNWDFPEVNPFAGAAGDIGEIYHSMAKTLEAFQKACVGSVAQLDAARCNTCGR